MVLSACSSQQFGFFFPSDEGGQAARVHRLEAAFRGTRPQCRPSPRWVGDALEVRGPEALQLEEIAEKSARAVANDNHVRLGDALQARRKVRRLANDGSLLRIPRADELTDDHNPGCNSDTGLQGSRRLERGNRYDQIEPGPHSPLRVIFMCPRIAKMHQDAVPHVSRHETVVPLP